MQWVLVRWLGGPRSSLEPTWQEKTPKSCPLAIERMHTQKKHACMACTHDFLKDNFSSFYRRNYAVSLCINQEDKWKSLVD